MDIDDFKKMGIWIPYATVTEGERIVNTPSLNGVHCAVWSDRSILMTYDQAADLAQTMPELYGIGFVIPKGYAVIALDSCYDEADNLSSKASHLVYKFHSYTERSPSGQGLYITIKANLIGYPKDTFVIEGQKIEVLTPGDFVPFTGSNIDADMYWIDECTTVMRKIFEQKGRKKRDHIEIGKNVDYSFGELHNCPYGKARLQNESSNVRRAKVGGRANALLNAAFSMGGLIYDGHISEDDVIRELEAAGKDTGLSYAGIRRALENGLKQGKLHPRDVKCGTILEERKRSLEIP